MQSFNKIFVAVEKVSECDGYCLQCVRLHQAVRESESQQYTVLPPFASLGSLRWHSIADPGMYLSDAPPGYMNAVLLCHRSQLCLQSAPAEWQCDIPQVSPPRSRLCLFLNGRPDRGEFDRRFTEI